MILNRIEGKPEEGMHGSSVSLQDSTRGSVKTIFLVIEKKGVEFDEGQKKCADTEAIETTMSDGSRRYAPVVRRSAPTKRRLRRQAPPCS